MTNPHDAINEPDWYPPPAASEEWKRWDRRVAQVLILNAVILALAVGLHLVDLISRKTTNWLLAAEAPALLCAWLGLIAYFFTRSAERSGTRSDRGRMLVVALDVFTAIFTVMGLCFWLAILTN